MKNILTECKEQGHKMEEENVGRCLTQYTCNECQITFKVDSGD